MTNGGPFGSTRVLSFFMFEESLSEFGFRMGYGAAIAVIYFLSCLVHCLLSLPNVVMMRRKVDNVPHQFRTGHALIRSAIKPYSQSLSSCGFYHFSL